MLDWDGSQENHVKESMASGFLPNLQSLVQQGGFAETRATDHATETMTGHAEMLTGYPWQITGVGRRPIDGHRDIPPQLTLFRRLNDHFGRDAVFIACMVNKPDKIPSGPGDAFYYMSKEADVWDGSQKRGNAVSGPLALMYLREAIRSGQRFLAYLHFREPDSQGHGYGENSAQYEAALEHLDWWLKRVRLELAEHKVDSQTAVFVMTDHGFDEGGREHSYAPDAWMATNIGGMVDGDQKDVTPTLLSVYGIDSTQFHPLLPGRSLFR